MLHEYVAPAPDQPGYRAVGFLQSPCYPLTCLHMLAHAEVFLSRSNMAAAAMATRTHIHVSTCVVNLSAWQGAATAAQAPLFLVLHMQLSRRLCMHAAYLVHTEAARQEVVLARERVVEDTLRHPAALGHLHTTCLSSVCSDSNGSSSNSSKYAARTEDPKYRSCPVWGGV
eukprot:1152901-Pelagomonas_calceolata.AAC.18